MAQLDELDKLIEANLLGGEAGKPEWYQPPADEIERLIGEALVAQDWDFLDAAADRLGPVIMWWSDAEGLFDHERQSGAWLGRNNVIVSALIAAGRR